MVCKLLAVIEIGSHCLLAGCRLRNVRLLSGLVFLSEFGQLFLFSYPDSDKLALPVFQRAYLWLVLCLEVKLLLFQTVDFIVEVFVWTLEEIAIFGF